MKSCCLSEMICDLEEVVEGEGEKSVSRKLRCSWVDVVLLLLLLLLLVVVG